MTEQLRSENEEEGNSFLIATLTGLLYNVPLHPNPDHLGLRVKHEQRRENQEEKKSPLDPKISTAHHTCFAPAGEAVRSGDSPCWRSSPPAGPGSPASFALPAL